MSLADDCEIYGSRLDNQTTLLYVKLSARARLTSFNFSQIFVWNIIVYNRLTPRQKLVEQKDILAHRN